MAQVITAQPGATVVVQQTQVLRDWNTGVFDCFSDIGSCKLTVSFSIAFLAIFLEAL